MKCKIPLAGLFFFFILWYAEAQIPLSAGRLKLVISGTGSVSAVTDPATGINYLASGQPSPLLQVRVNSEWMSPSLAKFIADDDISGSGKLLMHYPRKEMIAEIGVKIAGSYLRFELLNIMPGDVAEAVAWGPIPLTLDSTVAEIIGVAANGRVAAGLQLLNVKTLGGPLLNEEGSDPSRGQTARKTSYGSSLQAFSLERSKPRTIDVWWGQFPAMPVPPVAGEGVTGSAIALFGCSADSVMSTIEKIELAEGLPHPLIDGVWSKLSPETGRSYLIADYSESTVDELLAYTQQAGLMTLYHMNAWKSWGHYNLDSAFFPHGTEGFRACREKAHRLGIRLGAHTLTDFINTHDPYVTPVPDPRLAITGTSILTAAVTDSAREIPVVSPLCFSNRKYDWLRTARIGDELIRYDSVTGTEPFKLTGCTRGAFGTKASAHLPGDTIAKLLDHPYMVFFPNLDLMKEIARNLALRFNELGLEQMDFDGHEGCLSTGQGDYGMELFAKIFYDNLDHPVLNGTSNSEPFYWHINTYCNWGEPWVGGFTQSMQQYRLDNQGLLERNYLPNMLGWYLLTDSTTLEEMEWMLARAAGYNAGFAMATSLRALRENPNTGLLLDAIREWEFCRRAGLFPEALRHDLKDTGKAFHLVKISEGVWDLYPMAGAQDAAPGKAAEPHPPVRLQLEKH